ncbi:hypothetical protein LTR16_001535 [Cryomyces antarcticus]|uniref:F-box domain-containing protein n=1 Tax=Cryomyces antarcticus TaxID=329879 RepID=A0ABR0KU48_9PEZI|nr:hypothetical protein LTR39_003221 [Cryomyces antarcticus]KAK5130414.1 hypothetical protein LTR16_001535 [Cryomyces antarcticus]
MTKPPRCQFLELPTELRLLIYSYAIHDTDAITISAAQLVGPYPDITHRLYGDKRSPLPGLPSNHEAVIRTHYDASLLSIAHPPTIDVSRAAYETAPATPAALLLLNRQIHNEVSAHLDLHCNRNASLYVSFPLGLHVFRTVCPQLLRHARSIHICGAYASKSEPWTKPGNNTVNSKHHRRDPMILLRKFELRIYYPGGENYQSVWADDNSPIVVALRNICGGIIDIECWRGQKGTGVYLTARPNRSRIIGTVWRRLEEGRPMRPEVGSFAVDAKWPHWEEGYVPSKANGGGIGQ